MSPSSGRPGPVVIDIPKDIQFAKGAYTGRSNVEHKTYQPRLKGDPDKIKAAVALMANARRPLFYTGGGVINSGPDGEPAAARAGALTGFPITSTLMGLGAYPASDPQWLGMLGMHGTYEANWAMHDCDVMINIGARFDDRITGRLDAFSPGSKKIHVDIDPSSINKNVKVDIGIIGDCAQRARRHAATPGARGVKPDKAALAPGGSRSTAGARATASPTATRTRSSSRNTRSSGSMSSPRIATPTSPPRSASTRCGPRSSTSSRSRTAG